MRKPVMAAALATLWLTQGCVTEGRDFRSDISWIKSNKTTKDDVQLLLRDPYSVGNSGGRPTWTYGYYKYQLIGPSHQKELKLYWNPDGTINTFSFTSNFPDDTGKAKPATPGASSERAEPSDY